MNLDDSDISPELLERLRAVDAQWRIDNSYTPAEGLFYTLLLPYGADGVCVCSVAVSTTVRDGFRYHLVSAYVPGSCEYFVRDHIWGKMSGWNVFFTRSKFESYRGYYWTNNCGREFGDWHRRTYEYNESSLHGHAPVVNPEYLMQTSFRYCAYSPNSRYTGSLADYLTLYLQYPQIEMLSKLRLGALITPAFLESLTKNKKLQLFVRQHASDISSCDDIHSILRAVKYAFNHHCKIADACRHFELVTRYVDITRNVNWYISVMSPFAKRNLKVALDYERVDRLIKRCQIGHSEYGRYVRYAYDAGRDLNCDQVLYPDYKSRERFMASLETLERDAVRRKRAKKIADGKAHAALLRMREAHRVAMERLGVKIVSSFNAKNNCVVRMLSTSDAFRAEGKRMHNCIGNGSYFDEFLAGKIMCVVISFDGNDYDVEISLHDFKVKQCYAKCNRVAPLTASDLAANFAKHLKKEFKKRKGKAAA